LIVLVLWMLFAVLWFAMIFASIAQQIPHPTSPPLGLLVVFPLFWLFGMGMWVAVLVVAVLFAIRAGRGEWAEYPVIGQWVRHILHI